MTHREPRIPEGGISAMLPAELQHLRGVRHWAVQKASEDLARVDAELERRRQLKCKMFVNYDPRNEVSVLCCTLHPEVGRELPSSPTVDEINNAAERHVKTKEY